jgi:hypothetical protein
MDDCRNAFKMFWNYHDQTIFIKTISLENLDGICFEAFFRKNRP